MATLEAVHDAMVATITAHFDDRIQTVAAYNPAWDTPLNTPAVLLELENFSEGQDLADGRVPLRCRFTAHCVLSWETPSIQMEIRNFGAEFFQLLRRNRWGLEKDAISNPDGADAGEGEFQPKQDKKPGFESWAVSWEQTVYVGADEWETAYPLPTAVFLGWSPEIGPDNVEKYVEITATGATLPNVAPTAITLDNLTVSVDAVTGDTVGNVIVTDPNSGDTHAIVLVSQETGGAFAVAGSVVKVADDSLIGSEGDSHVLTLRATDQGGLSLVGIVTIAVGSVGGGSAPPPFALSDIQGDLTMWFDAYHVSESDGAVSSLPDQSPRGLHAVQANPSRQPTWQTVSGLPIVAYDGIDDYMATAFATWPKTQVVGGVIRMRSTTGYGVATYYLDGWVVQVGYVAGKWTLFAGGAHIEINAPATSHFARVLIELTDPGTPGAQFLFSVDDQTASMAAPSGYTGAARPVVFGAYRNASGGFSAFGALDLAEWFGIGRAFASPAEKSDVMNYLASRWSALP